MASNPKKWWGSTTVGQTLSGLEFVHHLYMQMINGQTLGNGPADALSTTCYQRTFQPELG